MKKNLGSIDRTVRILLAVLIAGLYYGDIISGTVGIVMLVLAIVFLLTSLISFCPLYYLLGVSTCPTKSKT